MNNAEKAAVVRWCMTRDRIEREVASIVRTYLDCPIERRPSPMALTDQILKVPGIQTFNKAET